MISILAYHQISQVPEQQDPFKLAVPPWMFEKQMAYLHRAGYRCVSLGEAVRWLREGQRQPRKSFVLTFDDGYQNVYSEAVPVLCRFGFTATTFLVAKRVGYQSDWDGQTGSLAAPLLSWNEVREMLHLGFTFGSHTLTHPRLTLLDDKQAMHEIRDSKAIIEDHLGVKVDLFSYPYTNFDARIQRMVAGSGYIAACGGDQGPWGLFNLWRGQCRRNENLLSFALKATGWYYQTNWLHHQSLLGRSLRHTAHVLRCLRGNVIESPIYD